MKRIFIVGSINTDLVITTPVMPKAGETITGGDFFTARGGKGANQAVACARLGGKVIMCGCVGDDLFGQEAIESLKKDNIDVSHIRTVKGVASGTAVIVVENGDNRIILDKGANACLSKRDIDGALSEAENGDLYLTQLENPIEVIGYGLKKAKEKGLYVILNPAPANVVIEPFLEYCDLIVPNETETDILGGKEKILNEVPKALITLGSKGFKLAGNGIEDSFPCPKVKVVDTTAAGDTLCGGLAAYLSIGKDLVEAAKFGSTAASMACTKKGAQPSIPTKEEVEMRKDFEY